MSDRAKQRNAVLNALLDGPKTKWQLIMLGQCHPGARIHELRKMGYPIATTEKRVSGKRITTFTLLGYSQMHSAKENASDSEQQRTPPILACAECHQGIIRKSRAKPLRQGEFPFCSDAHRAAFHRRKGANVEVRPVV